jgi:thioredoxin-like negative regulator of GroEL
MILLFTSKHCTWCDIVKNMIEEESSELGCREPLFEVNVEHHSHIAEAYGIFMVPTLVSRNNMLSGVPCQDDLRAFLLRSLTETLNERGDGKAAKAIRSAPRKFELLSLVKTSTVRPMATFAK